MMKFRDWVHINNLNWYNLSSNPNAIEILKENQDKIHWKFINVNHYIFTYDYDLIEEKNKDLCEEIIK
jgi:hypothetical protein